MRVPALLLYLCFAIASISIVASSLPLAAQTTTQAEVVVASRKDQHDTEKLLIGVTSTEPDQVDTIVLDIPRDLRITGHRIPKEWIGPIDGVNEMYSAQSRRMVYRRATFGSLNSLSFSFDLTKQIEKVSIEVRAGEDALFSRRDLPVARLYSLHAKRLANVILFPPQFSPGDSVVASPLQSFLLHPDGKWKLFAGETSITGELSKPNDTFLLPHLIFKIPPDLRSGVRLRISYIDPWGEELFDIPIENEARVVALPTPASSEISISNADPLGVSERFFCISGSFPNYDSLPSINIDLRSAKLAAASRRSLIVLLPQLTVGRHSLVLSEPPQRGLFSQDIYRISFKAIKIKPATKLEGHPKSRWLAEVEGTDEKLPIVVTNLNTSTYKLTTEGGDSLDSPLLSSGGLLNYVRGYALRREPGEARLLFYLPPTCSSSNYQVSPDETPRITRLPEELPQSSPQTYSPPPPPPLPPPPSPEEFRTTIEEVRRDFRSALSKENLPSLSKGGQTYLYRPEVVSAIRSARIDLNHRFRAKELAALRDFITKEINGMIPPKPNTRNASSAQQFGFAKAAYDFDEVDEEWIDEQLVKNLLETMDRLLDRLFGAGNHLTIAVCVATVPEKANFIFYPVSDRSNEKTISTNGLVKGVWIGTYAYRIEQENSQEVKGFEFDFVDDSITVLECPLVAKGKVALACRPGSEKVKTECLKRYQVKTP